MSAENKPAVRETVIDLAAIYTPHVLANNHQGAQLGAATIVPPVLAALSLWEIHSVVDFGCGLGTWLAVFAEHGITDIDGYDGPWVPREQLQIPVERFHPVDLREDVPLPRRWDLALCLETAEHLPPNCAESLVTLVTSAAPVVLWSAAVPGQGGWYHLNEQPEQYWHELFVQHRYRKLVLPGIAALDAAVPSWYRRACLYVDMR